VEEVSLTREKGQITQTALYVQIAARETLSCTKSTKETFMEIIKRTIPRYARIVDASDLHWDAMGCHKAGVRKMIQFVKQENEVGNPTYLNLKGDLMEAIVPGDKRFNTLTHDMNFPTPQVTADALIQELWDVREFILAIGDGNHELKLSNIMNFGKYMADKLGVPHGAYTYITEFRDEQNKKLFKTFSSHGSGRLPKGAKDPIQRLANRKAHLKRKLDATGFTDCVYRSMGHTHQLLIVEPTYKDANILTTKGGQIHQNEIPKVKQNASYIPHEQCWSANTGGFLKLYSPPGSGVTGYAEQALMEPTDLGWVEVEIAAGEIVDVKAVKV
jgi:hypothetical protein